MDEDIELAAEDGRCLFSGGQDGLRVCGVGLDDVDVCVGFSEGFDAGGFGVADEGEDGVGGGLGELADEFAADAFGGAGDCVGRHCVYESWLVG